LRFSVSERFIDKRTRLIFRIFNTRKKEKIFLSIDLHKHLKPDLFFSKSKIYVLRMIFTQIENESTPISV